MKRILGEVSVKDFDGCLKKIMELLEHEQFGHYHLYKLGQFLHELPTEALTQKWLEDLSYKHIWERAEEHFKKTKKLWYNELEWPFQICVIEIGGLSNQDLQKKWLHKFSGFYSENQLTKNIDDFDLSDSGEKRKIKLIRLKAKYLGFTKNAKFNEINCCHNKFNLFLCPPETAFFMRPLVNEYFDREETIFSSNFKPGHMVDKTKKRFFYFHRPKKSYGNDLDMGVWDISPAVTEYHNSYWIFQYILPN